MSRPTTAACRRGPASGRPRPGAELVEAVAPGGDQEAVRTAGLGAFEVAGRVPDHPGLVRRQVMTPQRGQAVERNRH